MMGSDMKVTRRAIKISQPFGDFFVFSLGAKMLNQLTYSLPAAVVDQLDNDEETGGYRLLNFQRPRGARRLESISKFIRSEDAAFPNAVVLSVNVNQDGEIIDNDDNRWTVAEDGHGHLISIPSSSAQSASIIDGQHRLYAFNRLAADDPRRDMEILCVAYFELPLSLQAFLFATINLNQKKVDKSLAYELFGFEFEENDPMRWPPETLAVWIARLLNTEPLSPLHRNIVPGAVVEDRKSFHNTRSPEKISIAVIVEGIIRLISKSAADDRYEMRTSPDGKRRTRKVLKPIDGLPLRKHYIDGNDRAIYELLFNFFTAIRTVIIERSTAESYLRKTVGFQAYFDVLKWMLERREIRSFNYSVESLERVFENCSDLPFVEGSGYQASGIGRTTIRQDIIRRIESSLNI